MGHNVYGTGVDKFAIGNSVSGSAIIIDGTGAVFIPKSLAVGRSAVVTIAANGSATVPGNIYSNGAQVATLTDISNINGGTLSAFSIPDIFACVLGMGYVREVTNYADGGSLLISLFCDQNTNALSVYIQI